MTPEEIRRMQIEEIPFHGGFRPEDTVDEGFQPEGDPIIPATVPRLGSAIVPPHDRTASPAASRQPIRDETSTDNE